MIAAVIAVGVRLIAPFPWIFDIDDRDFMPLVLVVPLLGAYALYHAARGLRWSLRARKFGASVLEIDGGVGRLGRPLEGVVRTARPLRPAGDYRIVLQCIDTHRMQSKSDRTEDRSSVVWARTLTVPAAGVDSSAGIPFSFMLPSAAPEPESVQGAGGLRVDMPLVYGRRIVLPLLAALQREHPGLQLDLRLQDAYADLVRDGLDLAIRVGVLRDSTLVARRIDWQQLIFVASPDYLRGRGTPRRIGDLAAHAAVVFRMPGSGRARPWQLRQGRRDIELQPVNAVQVNDGEGMVAAACLGLGLTQVPDYMAHAELAAGALVEVLAAARPARMPISVVYPSSRLVPPRVRVALDALEALRERGRA